MADILDRLLEESDDEARHEPEHQAEALSDAETVPGDPEEPPLTGPPSARKEVRPLAGTSIFLCPLGSLTALRRRLFEPKIISQGGSLCVIGSMSSAAVCVVDAVLPQERYEEIRVRYGLPPDCKFVNDMKLVHVLNGCGSQGAASRKKKAGWQPDAAEKKKRL